MGKYLADQLGARRGQVDVDEAPVFFIPSPFHQFAAFQVVDHHGDVASAFQQLQADLALVHRAQMMEGLHHAELGHGEAFAGLVVNAGQDRFRRANQFDIGVQGPDLGLVAFEMSPHVFPGSICL